jgi:hypothetical protein
MTTTGTAPISPTRPVLSRWLAVGVCVLLGLRLGLDAALFAGAAGARLSRVDLVMQIATMAVLAGIVLRGLRGWLGFAVACLAYSLTVALVQLPDNPTRWTMLRLTHYAVLIVAVVGLWLTGIQRPPPDRLKLATAIGVGATVGAAAGVVFAEFLLTT